MTMHDAGRLVPIAALALAGCGGAPDPLVRFAASAETRLPIRALAPEADIVCELTPYRSQVSGAGAGEINRYVADHHLAPDDEGTWLLVWKRGGRILHRIAPRRPVDLVNDGGPAVQGAVPKDLRAAVCVRGADGVLVKLAQTDRVNAVLAAPAAP